MKRATSRNLVERGPTTTKPLQNSGENAARTRCPIQCEPIKTSRRWRLSHTLVAAAGQRWAESTADDLRAGDKARVSESRFEGSNLRGQSRARRRQESLPVDGGGTAFPMLNIGEDASSRAGRPNTRPAPYDARTGPFRARAA